MLNKVTQQYIMRVWACCAVLLLLLLSSNQASACPDCSRKFLSEVAALKAAKHSHMVHVLSWCGPGYFDPNTGLGIPFFCKPCGYNHYCQGE
jgi:hypothetical protein